MTEEPAGGVQELGGLLLGVNGAGIVGSSNAGSPGAENGITDPRGAAGRPTTPPYTGSNSSRSRLLSKCGQGWTRRQRPGANRSITPTMFRSRSAP